MPLFLVPVLIGAAAGAGVGAAAYSAMTQEEAGNYTADVGGRQLDAYQIYEQLHAGDNGSSLMTGRNSASMLKNSFSERIAEMDALAARMDEAWQGDSAEAAKAGAHPLKQWLEDSQIKLHESDNTMASQLDAFNTVLSRVQPVPADPPKSNFLNDITPWETDTDRAIKQYNEMAQANVEAYNAYYTASSSNARSLPTYTTVDGDFGEIEVDDTGGGGDGGGRDRVGGGPYPGGPYPGGGGGGGSNGSVTGGPYPSGSYPGGVTGGPYPGGPYPGGSGNGTGSGTGSGTGIGGPGYQYTPGQYDSSTSASNYTVPKTSVPDFTTKGTGGYPGLSPTGGPSLGSGSGGGGSFGGGGAGGGGAFGGGVMGAGGAMGAASPGAGSGAAAPGTSSGMAARGAMGGAAAAGAGARGGAMPMGAMGGAGGRGQGAEDEEHQRKYLVEEDGNSLFGTDELTAPPVIGE